MRNLIVRLSALITLCAMLVGYCACSSDNDFKFDYGSEKSVKEDIAMAMAAGTYHAAYVLDTIRIYVVYDDAVRERSVQDYDGGSFPKRGDYMEILGDKILSPAYLYREKGSLARLAYKLMTGQDGENYLNEFCYEKDFKYDLLTSRIGRTSQILCNYELVYADDEHIVIRELSERIGRYDDYYFVRTTPREVITFKDGEEAWEFFKQKLIEFVGEEKFNELLENSANQPYC